MKGQIERIKIKSHTKYSLEQLKTEEDWTFDLVLQTLLDEHFELNDPELLEEKEKKLHEEYVPILDYNKLYDENIDNRKKVKELTDEYETQLEEIKDKEEQFTTKLKEQQGKCVKLEDILIAKEEEIKSLDITNKELKEKLGNLNVTLSNIQKKYEACDSDYRRFRDYVDSEYLITRKQLQTLFYIILFLSKHKRRVFSLDELGKGLSYIPDCFKCDIVEALPLCMYKIFPTRMFIEDDVKYYFFDRHYLRR